MQSSEHIRTSRQAVDFVGLIARYHQDWVCVFNEAGILIASGEKSRAITGYDPEDLLGKHADSLAYPEDEGWFTRYAQYLHNGGPQVSPTACFRFLHADGRCVWLQAELFAHGPDDMGDRAIVAVSRDVSAEVQSRRELDRAAALLEAVSRQAQIGFWEISLPVQQIWWSDVALSIHESEGKTPESLEEWATYFPPEGRSAFSEALDEAIELGRAFDLVLPFITARDHRSWVRISGQPLHRQNRPNAITGLIRLFNEDAENTQHLRSVLQDLHRKNQQLEEFNQSVSHNLRSPVSNLRTLTDLLQSTSSDTDRNRYLGLLQQLSEKLSSVLEDLVDATKIMASQELPLENIDLWRATHHVMALLQGDILATRAKVQIDFSACSHIRFPKIYFESVMVNLLTNAIKYRDHDRPLVIKVFTTYSRGTPTLTVADNGSGIDLDRHGPRLFRLHKTFHPERPGKGLGLFLIKKQIESVGGSITVESTPGRGAAFHVSFPS